MFLSSQGDSITFGVPNLMSLSPLKLIWDFHHWGAQSMELKWSLIYFLTLVCLTAGLMNTKYTTLTSCLNSTHETPAICFNEIQTRVFNVVIEGSFIDKCWHSSVNKLNIVTADWISSFNSLLWFPVILIHQSTGWLFILRTVICTADHIMSRNYKKLRA